jgi:hypothetical protein
VLPFTADNALALVDMHRREPAPAVESLQPDAPRDLAALTAAALRKDPAQRPADGAALLSALAGAPTTVVMPGDTQATQVLATPAVSPDRPPSNGRWRVALAGAAIVLLAAGGGVLAWAVTRPGSAAPAGHRSTRSAPGTRTGGRTGTTHSIPTTSTRPTTQSQPTTTAGHTTTSIPTTAPTTIPTTTPTTVTVPTTTTVPTVTTPTTTAGVGTTTTTVAP